MDIQLAVGKRQRQQRFLSGRIRDFAFGEYRPGHDGALDILRGEVRPAGAQKSLVGIRPVEAHPVEIIGRALQIAVLKKQRTEYQVRFVTYGQFRGVVGLDKAGLVELLDCRVRLPGLQVGDTEVVSREPPITL